MHKREQLQNAAKYTLFAKKNLITINGYLVYDLYEVYG